MFEDLARNLVVPHQLGMTTVLVVPDGAKEVVREDWELEGRDAAYVDHVTDDLTGFLERVEHLIGVVPANAGTHTPRPLVVRHVWQTSSSTITHRGYGSLRSQGRRAEP